MNLKKLITSSMFLAIGAILHQITPPIFLGMKPDFLLAMMFITIFVFDDYKLSLLVGAAAGVFTAATTNFPGGQIPNLIDKIITANCIYFLYKALKNSFNSNVSILIISFIGTVISGAVFLGSAGIMFGLPGSFLALMISVVVPAATINTVTTLVFYRIVHTAMRLSYRQS